MSARSAGPVCSECGRPATGNFCQSCGAKLGGRFCNQCGAELGRGAAFCNQCGSPADGAPAGSPAERAALADSGGHRSAAAATIGGRNLPWWIAGAALFALIVAVGVSMIRPAGPVSQGQPPVASAPGAGTPPDLSTMTPRQAADRLFNRVMTSAAEGDSAGAQAFLPMAIGAYERAMPLDHDGSFHLSMLQRTAAEFEAALTTASAVLEEDPDHILALYAAAQAAIELGRDDEAEAHYRHLLEVYDAQVARGLEDYTSHENIMTSAKSAAEAFLAGR